MLNSTELLDTVLYHPLVIIVKVNKQNVSCLNDINIKETLQLY